MQSTRPDRARSRAPARSSADCLRTTSRSQRRFGPCARRIASRALAEARVKQFDVRMARSDAAIGTLSGGNQQKIVLAREIGRDPGVLIAFQPTWGLDPGATRFVIETIL